MELKKDYAIYHVKLTLEEANSIPRKDICKKVADQLNLDVSNIIWSSGWSESTGYAVIEVRNEPMSPKTTTPINNHVCTSCKENRCNKMDRVCWRCQNPIQP